MSTTPTPRAADAQDGLTLARERTRAYLEAAGLDARPADELTARILDQVTAEGGPSSPEVLALAALRLARRAIADQAARAAKADPAAPSIAPVRPLAMPRRTLRSFMDWRLAASTLRRLLPARAPRRVRHGGHPETQASARLSLQARRRRLAFLGLILLTTAWGVATFVQILGVDGLNLLDLAHTAVFSIPPALARPVLLDARGGDGRARPAPPAPAAGWPRRPTRRACRRSRRGPRSSCRSTTRTRTASSPGCEAMWRGCTTRPEGKRCDLFVLSDTTDPDVWLAEEAAWRRLREAAAARRADLLPAPRCATSSARPATSPTSCSRWGGAYDYMLVLDADSLMSGDAMVELAEPMDANPDVGMIQTPPQLVAPDTAVRAACCSSPARSTGRCSVERHQLLVAMGEGNYWGHNAIIRVRRLRRACAACRLLPGQAAARRRDPEPRLRRGRADAPRRLAGLDRRRPRRQLRGDRRPR